MKNIRIRLTQDVTIYHELTYHPIMTYKKGQELDAYSETNDAYFVGPGFGIWKTEAQKLS